MKEMIEHELLPALEQTMQAGKWKAYEEYKDSDTEWLGKIPEHWKVKRIKYIGIEPLKYGANEIAEQNDHTQPRYIRITDINEDGTLREDTFRSLPEHIAKPYLLKYGDLLFARSGATVGKSFLYQEYWGKACYAGYLIRLRVNLKTAFPLFISYFVNSSSYKAWLDSIYIQATIQNVSAEKYANLATPQPPLHEQQAIVTFLDRETARINDLIVKKERMIALLQERRTAIINQTITKGLHPDVPMRDSGVEWLGKIPAHWEVRKLKHSIYSIKQGWSPACENRLTENDEEWGVLKVGCVNGTEFNDKEHKTLPKETSPIPELEIKSDDILMSRANTRDLLGSTSIVRQVRPKLILCDKLYRLKLDQTVLSPDFFVLAMGTSVIRFQLERDATGASSSMQNISQFTIVNVILPIPNAIEQQKIISYVNQEISKIDKLISVITEGIKKLKEYNTALISAAVTGKIDVRGELLDIHAEETAL